MTRDHPGWRTALLLYGAVGGAFVALYLPQPILPVLALEFGAPASRVSLAVSVTILAFALASLLVGPLSDRWGRRRVIVGCSLGLTLPVGLAALAPTLESFLAFRFLQGLLLPGLTAVTIAYITEEFPPERVPGLVGGYISASVLGGLTSRVLSGAVTEWLGWRPAFGIAALLLFSIGVLAWRTLPASRNFVPAGRLTEAFRGMARHLRNRRLVGGYAVGFGLFFAFLAVFTYLPFLLEAPPFSLSPFAIGLFYVTYLAGAVASPLAGIASVRLGRPNVMRLGLAVALAANLLTITSSSVALVGALLLLCFGNFATQGVATSYVPGQAARDRGGASSLYLFFYYVGGSLGAFLPGLLWPRFGWTGVVAMSVAALAFAAFAAVVWCRGDGAVVRSSA